MLAPNLSLNLFSAIISRLGVGFISLLVIGLLSRNLSPSDFGAYTTVINYAFLIISLADMGLMTLMIRELSLPRANSNSIAGTFIMLRLLIALIISLLGILIIVWLPYPAVLKAFIVLSMVYVLIASLTQLFTGIYQWQRQMHYVALFDIIARASQLLIVYFIVKQGAVSIFWGLMAMIMSEVFRFAILGWHSRKILKPHWHWSWLRIKNILRDALPIAASLIFVLIYFKLDAVLLSFYKNTTEVGFYSLAYKVLELTIYIPAIYVGLILPELSRHAVEAPRLFVEAFARAWRLLLAIALPTILYIIIMAPRLIEFIAKDGYEAAAVSLKILALAIFLIFFGNLGGNAIIALNLQKKTIWIYGIGAIINILGNVIYMPRYGYLAASWMTVVTELFVTFAMFLVISNKISYEWFSWRSFFVICLTSVPFGLSLLSLKDHMFLSLVLFLPYLGIILILRGLKVDDLKSFLNRNVPAINSE